MVFPKSLTALGRMASFVKELRTQEYDVVADFHGLLKSALICRAARAKRKVGYVRAGTKERSQFAYTETVTVPEGKLCRYARNMAMAEHLGGGEPNPANLLHGPDPVPEELSSFFESLPGDGPVFAIHQGTKPRATYKRWPGDRYAALADALVRKLGGRVVFTWAPEEREQVEAIVAAAKEKTHQAPRTGTPLELGYLLSRSDMYIGSDTGAAHIATIAGTPVLAIFGPTDPVENEPGPYSPHEIVMKDTDCSPCRIMKCSRRACMEAVEVKDVLAGVERLLCHS
jgi:ADP-heptose:LPS heptosyltransferase